MKKIKRIGLFGGSFDPVHNGHIKLGLAAAREYKLNKVFFIPAWQPPHKLRKVLVSANKRVQMLKLALKKYKNLKLNLFEINRKKVTYTFQTVQHFHKKYINSELFFIMGADSLSEFGTWKNHKMLYQLCAFIVGKRFNTSNKIKHKSMFLKTSIPNISSSDIRKKIKRNSPVRNLVPKQVEKFIKKHELYS